MPVRWNAFFLSAERFCENEKALRMFFCMECKQYALSDDEWIILKKIVEILKPLFTATKVLSGQKYTTKSLVIPTINALISKYNEMLDDPEFNPNFYSLSREDGKESTPTGKFI